MRGSLLNMLKDWLFRKYEVEKIDALRTIVARFSRGNVSVQQGLYLTEEQLVALSRKGDAAIENLEHHEAA